MNKNLTIFYCLIFSFIKIQAQQNKVLFQYDNAGNQISRTLCINCSQAGRSAVQTTEFAKLKTEELQKFFPEDQISYYPNPVKEELFLKWELNEENKVSEIQVFNLNGQLLKTLSKLQKVNSQTLQFQNFQNGTYLLVLIYTNGEQKTIKIIKE